MAKSKRITVPAGEDSACVRSYNSVYGSTLYFNNLLRRI